MTPSPDLLDFLRGWEVLALTAYLDSGGVPTIGYGHTSGVQMGDRCSTEEAEQWLADEACDYGAAVERAITVSMLQRQFDALTSFAYNVGAHALASSTLASYMNRGNTAAASAQIPRWCRDGGIVVPGLLKRRNAERAMFDSGDYSGRP